MITIIQNPVAFVHPAAFQGLRRLLHLAIYSHLLHVAPSLQFIGHSLLELDLSYSKVEFKPNYFNHRYVLQTLTVHNSDLREMPNSLCMIADSLETLYLIENSIITLKPLYKTRFIQLKWLFLYGNKISSLEPVALWLPRLRAIYLEDNHICQITDISAVSWGWNATGESGPTIKLDGNPWHCNASMNWLLQGLHRSEYGIVFERNAFMVYVGNWFCATPQEYQGRLVVDVLSIKPTTKNRGRKVNDVFFALLQRLPC